MPAKSPIPEHQVKPESLSEHCVAILMESLWPGVSALTALDIVVIRGYRCSTIM